MSTKTFNITRGVLSAFGFWCAALLFAILIALIALHVLVGNSVFPQLQP